MFENKVKQLLSKGNAAWGAGLSDASDLLAKLTVNTGIDFLWLDLEHSPYSVYEVRWIPIICRMANCMPMIRVPGLDPIHIKKALDIGANTIMVPQVNTAEEARLAVQYAKYPPVGTRGISPLWTMLMDISWDDYLPAANEETCVIVQVESPTGIDNLEAIADVEGVDVVFAGPMDIAASLGHIGQVGHPDVQKFLEAFPTRVAKCGKPSGITSPEIATCRKAYDQGYRFIVIGSLLHHGMDRMKLELKKLRESEV